jgi:hypothetical protein
MHLAIGDTYVLDLSKFTALEIITTFDEGGYYDLCFTTINENIYHVKIPKSQASLLPSIIEACVKGIGETNLLGVTSLKWAQS